MTGCSAMYCNNSAKKGYAMKVFPRDPERRAKWAANVGRKNWSPTNFSCLCEVHFEPAMWEKRIDGLRKLRLNAVPTIFGFFLKKQITAEKEERNMHNLQPKATEKSETVPIANSSINLSTCSGSSITISNVEGICNQSFETKPIIVIQNYPSTSEQNLIKKEIDITELSQVEDQKNLSNTLELLEKQAVKLAQYKNKLAKLTAAFQRLKKAKDENVYMRALQRIFTQDQIRALFIKSNRPRHWSKETIVKALQLRFACGERGYEELLGQNMPLPSIRTLQMRLQRLQKCNIG